MAWLSVMSLGTSDSKLRELAQGVANKSQSAVQARVGKQLVELPLAEARGYVRARSSSVIRREVDLLVASQPKLQGSRAKLFQMTSDAAVRQVVWQMLSERKQQRSAANEGYRRAA